MSLNRPTTNRNREVILIHVHSRDLERFKLDTTFRPAESPQKMWGSHFYVFSLSRIELSYKLILWYNVFR